MSRPPSEHTTGAERGGRRGHRIWYVDPVDGTYNYARNIPIWCTASALADGEDLLAGAVYQPANDELWVGGHRSRTTCNDVPVAPLTDRPLGELSIATYLHPTTLPDD